MVQLGANQYGKAEVRLVHVARGAGPDGEDLIRDWNVSTSLSGDLADSHLTGSNAKVLPTDSQKNKAYALAKELGGDVAPEAFAIELGVVLRVVSGADHPGADLRSRSTAGRRSGRPGTRSPGPATWCGRTVVHVDAAAGTSVVSGLKDLTVLNTTASEFWGYPKDAYTTLPETKDRILATSVNASWRFRPAAVVAGADWDAAFATARGGDPRDVRRHLLVLAAADAVRDRRGADRRRCRRCARSGWRCRTSITTSSTWRRSAWRTTVRSTWPATAPTG